MVVNTEGSYGAGLLSVENGLEARIRASLVTGRVVGRVAGAKCWRRARRILYLAG
jgi:hypothetical protein